MQKNKPDGNPVICMASIALRRHYKKSQNAIDTGIIMHVQPWQSLHSPSTLSFLNIKINPFIPTFFSNCGKDESTKATGPCWSNPAVLVFLPRDAMLARY